MRKYLAIVALLFWSSYTEATNRYIKSSCTNNITTYEPTGDTCTGGTDRVYSSLANALSAGTTVAGDSLIISDGTYAERLNTNTQTLPSGTDFGAGAVTIRARTGATVTFRPVGGAEVFNIVSSNHHIIFDHIIIDGSLQSSGEGISIGGSSHHIRFQDGEIKDAWNMCVFGQRSAGSGTEILRSILHGCGRDGTGYGVYVEADSWIFSNNEVYGNFGYGTHFYNGHGSGDVFSDGHTVNGNYVHDNLVGSVTAGGCAIIDGSNNTYYNNIFDNNSGSVCIDLYPFSSGSGNTVYNNTILHTGTGIRIGANYSNTLVRNNIIRTAANAAGTVSNSNGTSSFSNNLGCSTVPSNCFSNADPLFTNFAGNDFTLAAGSLGIGGGFDLSSAFTVDFDGTTRVVPWDVGAHEKETGNSLTLTAPNGSETYVKNTSITVTWSSTGSPGNVDIKYGTDGVTFGTVLVNATANDGTQSATLPNTASAIAYIQVCDDATGLICDRSDSSFAVTDSAGGSVTVIISNNTSGSKVGDINGVTSSTLIEFTPDVANGISVGIRANKGTSGQFSYSVIKFPTSSIPTSATVTAAELGLYLTSFSTAGTPSIDFRNGKRAFVQSEATFNIFSTGNSWGTAGGLNNTTDRDSAVLCNMSISATTAQYYTCSHADLVTNLQARVTAGTDANFHLERNGAGGDGIVRAFGVSDPQAAYLSVTYTTTAATITVSQPTTGGHLFPGDVIPVRWDSQGVSGNVSITLSRDGGGAFDETISSSTPFNQPDMVWTVTTGRASSSCLVKVCSVNAPSVCGTSSAFRIGSFGFRIK